MPESAGWAKRKRAHRLRRWLEMMVGAAPGASAHPTEFVIADAAVTPIGRIKLDDGCGRVIPVGQDLN